jgi:hypothetical protein
MLIIVLNVNFSDIYYKCTFRDPSKCIVTCIILMGMGEVFTGVWLGSPKGRDHWEDIGVSGGIT